MANCMQPISIIYWSWPVATIFFRIPGRRELTHWRAPVQTQLTCQPPARLDVSSLVPSHITKPPGWLFVSSYLH